MEPMFFITFSGSNRINIDLRYTLDDESQALFTMSSSKTCVTRQNFPMLYHFSRAQVWPAQLLFPYGNRAVNRQPSFRTEDSQSASSSHALLIFLFYEIQDFYIFRNFLEILIFSKLPKFRNIIGLVITLPVAPFMTCILIFNIRLTRFSVHFSQGHPPKH